jgi:hypothetical protein
MKAASITVRLLASACIATYPVSGFAAEPTKREFGYFLTKTELVAVVKQTLTACPDPANGEPLPSIETEWTIEAKPTADTAKYVNVDASSGFLVKRSTALKLRPDGTLESFASETAGQGGTVLSAIVKVAASIFLPGVGGVGPMMAVAGQESPAQRAPSKCTSEVVAKFAKITAWNTDIATLEAKVLRGEATEAQIVLLERRKNQRSTMRGSLILSSDPLVIDVENTTAAVDTKKAVKRLDYSKWFEPSVSSPDIFDLTTLIGQLGFQVSVSSDASPFPGDGTTLGANRKASPKLVYRRPVMAVVSAKPCAARVKDICVISDDPAYADASVSAKMPVSQLSGLYSLSTGRGGIFGTWQASAKFDATGAPIEISYGSDSGAADIASTITATGEAIVTRRDAELAALERQIKLEEARKKLSDLHTVPSTD